MDEREVKWLIWHLRFGNVQERRAASYKLGKSKISAIVPNLIAAYDDKDSSVQQNAVDGLFKIGSQEALDFLNSNNIKRTPVAHINPRALVFLGSLMMVCSLFMPLRGNYLIETGKVESYGFQSNLTYSALIGFLFIFLGLFKDGTPGKHYAPWAAIFPAMAIINLVFVFIETERLVIESDNSTTLGLALPLCIFGAFFLFAGCLTIVHNE
jgi:hypothetical protein